MFRLICILLGYFIGCIQSAFIVGKLMGNIDIREHGSGNAGTTNITRVLGAKAGLIVFVLDILKGILSFVLCSLIFKGGGTFLGSASILSGVYGGFGAILGHDFPFYLNFKGGKGTATTLGFILFINPYVAVITYVFGFIVVFITRYISLASLVMTLACFLLMILFKLETEAIIIMFLVMVLSYYQHLSNIKRLIKKEENKFSFKKQGNKK